MCARTRCIGLTGESPVVEGEVSPYNRRQASGDGISCGVVVAEDMVKLIQCQGLDIPTPYEYGALELRKNHVMALKDNRSVWMKIE